MLKRTSPMDMGMKPRQILSRNGWEIALSYVGERTRNTLFVTDLSHAPKWSLQGPNLDELEPAGLSMPSSPGSVVVDRGMSLARMSRSEARILALGHDIPELGEPGYTDVSEAWASLAVVGPRCFQVLSKLSAVDLEGPASPSVAMAPLEDVTCLLMKLRGRDGAPGLVISAARGYGHFILDAVLDAGDEYGIQAAGWQRFGEWLEGVNKL